MSNGNAGLSESDRLDIGNEGKVGFSNGPDTGDNATEKDAYEPPSAVVGSPEGAQPTSNSTTENDGEGGEEEEEEEEEEGDQQQSAVKKQKMSKSKIVLLTFALCLSTFLAALDMTIITTALPTISKDFQMSEAGYTWIGSSYLLAAAASTPSWGKISDIFGRKPMLLVANVTFLVGSLLCAVSVNVSMLIGGRVIQGIGGGGLLLLVQICISDLFSMRSRSLFFSILGMVWGVAGAVGPVFGGLLTQLITWRWCFYINLPLDGIALFITFFFLKIETPKTPLLAGLRAIDWLGSLAVVGGTIMFLLGLEYGGVSFPWSSPTVICLLVFGVLALGIFVLIEWKVSRYPIMPLWLFSQRSNVATYISGWIHAAVYMSGSYYLPLYFQIVLGATPLQSGLYLLPHVLSLSIAQLGTGFVAKKMGQSVPSVWFGTIFTLIGQGLYLEFQSHMSWGRIIAFQIITGIGLGPNFQALIVSLQSHLRANDVAAATSTFYFLRNIANSVSVVIGGVIFHNRAKAGISQLTSVLSPETMKALLGSSAGATTDVVRALPDEERAPVLEAYMQGLRTMWIFYTVLAAIGMLVSFMIRRKKLSKEHEVTKTGLEIQEQERKERLQRQKEKKDRKIETSEA